MRSNIKSFEFTDYLEGSESLVTSFLNVHDVLIEGKCVVLLYSKVFKILHYLNCLVMIDSRVLGERGADYRLLCLAGGYPHTTG